MQPNSNLNINRKRRFFIFSNSILGLVFIGLGWLNYMDNFILDVATDIFLVVLAICSLLSMKYFKSDMTIYRSTYFVVCLLFFLSIEAGIGQETIFYYTYAMPPLLFFYFGKREGTVWVILFTIGISAAIFAPSLFSRPSFHHFNISRFYVAFFIVVITSYGIEAARHTASRLLDEKNQALHKENLRLEQALKEIKTLSGLIPICASCKKIRNDQGFWQQVETYLREHSGANFSHGLCPDCIETLYPEYKPTSNT